MHVDFRIIIIRLFVKMSPSASRRCLQVKRVPNHGGQADGVGHNCIGEVILLVVESELDKLKRQQQDS